MCKYHVDRQFDWKAGCKNKQDIWRAMFTHCRSLSLTVFVQMFYFDLRGVERI